MNLDWGIILDYRYALLSGLWLTVRVAVLSIALSFIVGVLAGCARVLPNFFLIKFSILYADILRNIPVVVKLFVAYFVFGMDGFAAAVLALTLHQSSYISDVVASGIRSLPNGQLEAALSTGLSYRQAFSWIILPQALRITIPPMTTQFIQVLKNSSVVMLIALEDLTFMTQQIEHDTFRGMEAAITVTLMYLAVTLLIALSMSLLQRSVDRRFA